MTSHSEEAKLRQYEQITQVLGDLLMPLAPFFQDEEVTDICVNPDGSVWVHNSSGAMQQVQATLSADTIRTVGSILASRSHVSLNATSPRISATWPSPPLRIELLIPPAVENPCLAIRRPARNAYSLKDLLGFGMFSKTQLKQLTDLVHTKRNIIISGETGSGKTTLLSALINEIPHTERLVIIEDIREIRCYLPNYVSLLVTDDFSGKQAVMSALRQRPERIIYGEVRDEAALNLLDSWNTGHGGGLATIHANNPDAALVRLETLMQRGSMSPLSLARISDCRTLNFSAFSKFGRISFLATSRTYHLFSGSTLILIQVLGALRCQFDKCVISVSR